YRRRRRAQRLVSAGAAALVVVLAVAVAIGANERSSAPSSGPATSTTTTTQPDVTAADLHGAWRPVSIAGYDGPLTAPPLDSAPQVTFQRDRFTGNDGCNGLSGRYDLQPDGAFRQRDFMSTTVGCPSAEPLWHALAAAARIAVHDNRLRLLADDG